MNFTYGMGIVFGAAVGMALIGCTTMNPPKKEEPKAAQKDEPTPEVFKVNLDTSKGAIIVEIHRAWAPAGVDHFYTLVKTGFYNGDRFFRVVRNSIVQFGINGDPQLNRLWSTANLSDDPVKEKNVKGTLTYATTGANGRATQLFFNLRDNRPLDKQGFAPIGKVVTGMDVVESIYSSYGDWPPRGQGPDPAKIETQGNEYLQSHFPRLDYIKKATIQ
ncbi:MAG TPA: peptidylprolyl isomerase [Bryobacteraceae bacterium]